MFSDKRLILWNHLHDKVVRIVKITCHQHSIEVILANEDFILGSDPNDYLESALDENYDDLVGDKNEHEESSSKAPQVFNCKTIE